MRIFDQRFFRPSAALTKPIFNRPKILPQSIFIKLYGKKLLFRNAAGAVFCFFFFFNVWFGLCMDCRQLVECKIMTFYFGWFYRNGIIRSRWTQRNDYFIDVNCNMSVANFLVVLFYFIGLHSIWLRSSQLGYSGIIHRLRFSSIE